MIFGEIAHEIDAWQELGSVAFGQFEPSDICNFLPSSEENRLGTLLVVLNFGEAHNS